MLLARIDEIAELVTNDPNLEISTINSDIYEFILKFLAAKQQPDTMTLRHVYTVFRNFDHIIEQVVESVNKGVTLKLLESQLAEKLKDCEVGSESEEEGVEPSEAN